MDNPQKSYGNKDPFFDASTSVLEEEAQGKFKEKKSPIDCHAWLTVGPYIIDITLALWLEKELWLQNDLNWNSAIIILRHDQSLPYKYFPMLVGKEFQNRVMYVS